MLQVNDVALCTHVTSRGSAELLQAGRPGIEGYDGSNWVTTLDLRRI